MNFVIVFPIGIAYVQISSVLLMLAASCYSKQNFLYTCNAELNDCVIIWQHGLAICSSMLLFVLYVQHTKQKAAWTNILPILYKFRPILAAIYKCGTVLCTMYMHEYSTVIKYINIHIF